MKWHTLIHFIEDFNDEMVLLTKLLMPEKVILVTGERRTPESKLQQVLDYMALDLPNIIPCIISYEEEAPLELSQKLIPYLNEKTAVNLAGTSPLEVIIVSNLRQDYTFTMLYPEVKQNSLYILRQNKLTLCSLSKMIGTLEVKDYLALGGGLVLQDEKEKYESPDYKAMLSFLLSHYEDIFSKVRQLFKPTELHFSAPYEKQFYFEINRNNLTQEQLMLMSAYLSSLEKIGWVKRFEKKETSIRVYSKTKEMEHYLSSGAWLEHVTYYYMKQMKQVSDVHTGFKFAWCMKEKHVHNELDVIATLENKLVCISCKDTDKYDYQTLNELEVYATRLGGAESIKILVTTMPPFKSSTLDRAKGMGIRIIQIENSIKTLGEKLNAFVQEKG